MDDPTPSVARPAPSEELYRENFDFVWRNARRLGCDDDWVDDAVHEVFLVATRRLAEFEGRSSIRTWLFAITFRIVQRMQRDRGRYRQRIESYGREQSQRPIEPEASSETALYLRQLLSRLDDKKRVIVILAELEGFTSAEIARALNVKQGTVDSRLRAARIQLAKMIEHDSARDEVDHEG